MLSFAVGSNSNKADGEIGQGEMSKKNTCTQLGVSLSFQHTNTGVVQFVKYNFSIVKKI